MKNLAILMMVLLACGVLANPPALKESRDLAKIYLDTIERIYNCVQDNGATPEQLERISGLRHSISAALNEANTAFDEQLAAAAANRAFSYLSAAHTVVNLLPVLSAHCPSPEPAALPAPAALATAPAGPVTVAGPADPAAAPAALATAPAGPVTVAGPATVAAPATPDLLALTLAPTASRFSSFLSPSFTIPTEWVSIAREALQSPPPGVIRVFLQPVRLDHDPRPVTYQEMEPLAHALIGVGHFAGVPVEVVFKQPPEVGTYLIEHPDNTVRVIRSQQSVRAGARNVGKDIVELIGVGIRYDGCPNPLSVGQQQGSFELLNHQDTLEGLVGILERTSPGFKASYNRANLGSHVFVASIASGMLFIVTVLYFNPAGFSDFMNMLWSTLSRIRLTGGFAGHR